MVRRAPTPVPARAILLASLLLALAPLRPVPGEENARPHPAQGPLDGMKFVGTFGPEGEPGDREDVLYFGDGHFWSRNCVPCGFPPGEYWVRYSGGAVHFRGELQSSERGRFAYSGVIRDGRVTAHINWRKERWYWTIDRDFRFEGVLVQRTAELSASRTARLARTAGPPADGDCEP